MVKENVIDTLHLYRYYYYKIAAKVVKIALKVVKLRFFVGKSGF